MFNYFKKVKKVEIEKEDIRKELRKANLTIQTLQENLTNIRSDYDSLLEENKTLYIQLKEYQEKVEREETKKATTKKATTKKTTTKKTTTKKTTTKKTTTKKKGEDK